MKHDENPTRVIWDSNLEISQGSNIYNELAKTIILNKIRDEQVSDSVRLINVANASLRETMEILFNHGINKILVEGGSVTIGHFVEAGLWNEARIITTNRNLYEQGNVDLVKAVKMDGKCINEYLLFGDEVRIVKKVD